MSFISQLTIIIIHYIGILGLLVCSLLSLFLADKKKKLLFLFLFFLFVGILSFVYYSGVLFFAVGVIVVFFFILLYLFAFQMELFGEYVGPEVDKNLKNADKSSRNKILSIIISLLFCAAIGYFIYGCISNFLKEIKEVEGSENILIANWSDISNQFFSDYGLILIIITAALFVSFLWFIGIRMDKK